MALNMARAAYTAGEINEILYLKESTYGVTPKNGTRSELFNRGPQTVGLGFNIDIKQYRQFLPGDRSFNPRAAVSQGRDVAFQLTSNELTTGDWTEPLLVGALGMPSGTDPLANLPSYSMILGLGSPVKGNSVQQLYNGCSVNSLNITADEPKGVLQWNAEIWARLDEEVVNGAVSKVQNFTLDLPTRPATVDQPPVLRWYSGLRLNGDELYPESWGLTVNNNLGRTSGQIIGADGNIYNGTICFTPGQRSLQVTAEVWFADFELLRMQWDNEYIDSLAIDIGDPADSATKTITLTNGVFAVSQTDLTQDKNTITLTMDFASAVVA